MNTLDDVRQEIYNIKFSLNSLSLYRNLLKDPVLIKLSNLVDTILGTRELLQILNAYNELSFTLLKSNPNISLSEYIIPKLIFDENPFSCAAEIKPFANISENIKKAAYNDLYLLQQISSLSSQAVKSLIYTSYKLSEFERNSIELLPSWDSSLSTNDNKASSQVDFIANLILKSTNWSDALPKLADFQYQYGSGIFCNYKAFVWQHTDENMCLRGIENPDPITFSDLIGYEEQRSEVINNTLHFLDNFPANNVLLYGDRGTGKSSTVKALLNEYYEAGLRLVEIPKKHLIDFPDVIRLLSKRKQKFIIFIDDLSFEDSEESYTALKAVLEGGVESKPNNVIIYATSNRRHLIREKFSDRAGLTSSNPDDEIRATDTIQEKLSLSDRFGITIVFSSPDKSKYLEIVKGLAEKRSLNVDTEFLHREALKWELWYNGRSPRTAKQFVDWLEGQLGKKD